MYSEKGINLPLKTALLKKKLENFNLITLTCSLWGFEMEISKILLEIYKMSSAEVLIF